ncbi:hypothetical protein HG530_012426 [Fusarium avenaceum]|nr:hypothetical protein HG530_012426 [Fusarium avenaceum]
MSASKRFLSDFTLGFSDGLTVPFALTAGLSSLGKTDTVITGGLAELCAGSISMGIGGYLAARDQCIPCQNEVDVEQRHNKDERISESDSMVEQSEKAQVLAEELVRQHLEPLHLPSSMVTTLLNNMSSEPADLQRMVSRLQTYKDPSTTQTLPQSPIISGLSISLGYAIGGTIPLLPYFFASTVAHQHVKIASIYLALSKGTGALFETGVDDECWTRRGFRRGSGGSFSGSGSPIGRAIGSRRDRFVASHGTLDLSRCRLCHRRPFARRDNGRSRSAALGRGNGDAQLLSRRKYNAGKSSGGGIIASTRSLLGDCGSLCGCCSLDRGDCG